MTLKKQLAFAWTLVAILAILLAVAGYFLSAQKVEDKNITEKRDSIREHCAATDPSSKAQCAQDLQDLTDLLREFSQDMAKTAPVKPN